MRRNYDYVLRKIGDSFFLLAMGWTGSLPVRQVKINSVGATIWNLLDREMPREELVARCQEYFECENDEERELVEKQVSGFIDEMLLSRTFIDCSLSETERDRTIFEITEDHFRDENNEKTIGTYKIGRLGVEICGDEEVLPDNFEPFKGDISGVEARQTIVLTYWPNGSIITPSYVAKRYEMADSAFIGASGMAISRAKKGYVIVFDKPIIRWMFISKDGEFVEIVYRTKDDEIKQSVYETTRIAFAYFAEHNSHIILHSASLINNGKAVLFSAMSGVGKSTHAALWEKNFGSHMFNGDLNLLTIENGEAVVYGLPWCGSSENYENGRHPLGTIVLLYRGDTNYVEEISADEKTVHCLNRLISPNWTESQLDNLLNVIVPVTDKCDVFRLFCNMDDEAAIVCKKRVENQ